jgi:hypothetical protein
MDTAGTQLAAMSSLGESEVMPDFDGASGHDLVILDSSYKKGVIVP